MGGVLAIPGHVGFAISRVNEREALATLQVLEQMGPEYQHEIRDIRASAMEAMEE